MEEAKQKSLEEKEEAGIQQQAAEPSRDKIVNEVKQIMNKVFFKIREKFVDGDSYKGSAIISVVLSVIKVSVEKLLRFNHNKNYFYCLCLVKCFLFVSLADHDVENDQRRRGGK